MAHDLKPCPFGNANCMCQFCEEPCNNGLNCSDCNYYGEIKHDVYLCTGFVGDIDAYITMWKLFRSHRRPPNEEKFCG